MMFSITTMEPSTSIPSAIAMPPSDIRFAEMPDDRQRGAERHGERHDQRRLEVPECDCQDNEHQYDTLKESVFYCPAGIVHKIRLIVIRYDAYAFGQIFTDFLQFFMERFNDA